MRRLFRSLHTLLFQRKYFVAYEVELPNGKRIQARTFLCAPRHMTQKNVEAMETFVKQALGVKTIIITNIIRLDG